MKQLVLSLSILLLGIATGAQAQSDENLKAVTLDGRPVLLKSDNTWEFEPVEPGDPSTSAVLSVTRLWDMEDACKLQFRLQNNLGYRISALVPRLSVQNNDGIIYDTKSIAFASIKPTNDQYTEIQFSGIGCHNIAHIKVFDAGRCRMGEIDQWNEEEGECLSHIYVEPSQDINISK
ncbi:MAG: hypothetical protein R3E64_02315 [Halioglobus sp.]